MEMNNSKVAYNSLINMGICKFLEMPTTKKRRNASIFNLVNFWTFTRENSEEKISQTDQLRELRDIRLEIRPDGPLDTEFLVADNPKTKILSAH